MGSFEILDHTADLALRITGDNRDDLFRSALDGLVALSEIDKAKIDVERMNEIIEAKGDDDEELLIRFLNELLDMIQDRKLIPVKVLDLAIGNGVLKSVMEAGRVVEFPDGYVEIKAATYHMLKIVPLDGKLTVTVIFDV